MIHCGSCSAHSFSQSDTTFRPDLDLTSLPVAEVDGAGGGRIGGVIGMSAINASYAMYTNKASAAPAGLFVPEGGCQIGFVERT